MSLDMQSHEQESDYDFVFAPDRDMGGVSRWDWLAGGPRGGPLGDIRTYLDGMEHCYPRRAELAARDAIGRGGGNLGAPIVLMAYIELLARLYVGDAELDPGKYDATSNVLEFVEAFFARPAQQVPRVLWQGIRHGLTHSFRPKPLVCQGVQVRFRFLRERSVSQVIRRTPSQAEVIVSVPDLFDALTNAIQSYKRRLETERGLCGKFRRAWEALDRQPPREVRGEQGARLAGLLQSLQPGERVSLFGDEAGSATSISEQGLASEVMPAGLAQHGTASRSVAPGDLGLAPPPAKGES